MIAPNVHRDCYQQKLCINFSICWKFTVVACARARAQSIVSIVCDLRKLRLSSRCISSGRLEDLALLFIQRSQSTRIGWIRRFRALLRWPERFGGSLYLFDDSYRFHILSFYECISPFRRISDAHHYDSAVDQNFIYIGDGKKIDYYKKTLAVS